MTASPMRRASWSSAALRFCDWDRKRLALERTADPYRSCSSDRSASLRASDAPTLKVATTRVSDRFACWPPGPPDVVTRSSTSSPGIVSRDRMNSEPSSWR